MPMMKSEDRLIKIGEKISIIFEDASSFYNPNQLIVEMLFHLPDQKKDNDNYLNFVELGDKVWIQIGENLRVYGEKNKDLEKERLIFKLDKFMLDDLVHKKMIYAGIDHPKYNIKTKEVASSTLNFLASQYTEN